MSEQRRFWRDCADAQARLNLRCSHRRLVPNSLDAVHFKSVMLFYYFTNYCFIVAGFRVVRTFDPNALFQQQSSAAQQYMTSGGGAQSPPGTGGSGGSSPSFNPNAVNQASQSGVSSGTPTFNLSHLMTKPTMWLCPQRRLRSVWAGHPPSLIRVFAVRMKKGWILSYPLNAQQRL